MDASESTRVDDETPTGTSQPGRWRSIAPMVLVVVAAILVVVSTLTTWVRAELLDTDAWVAVSDELLAEPEVQAALATFVSDRLFEFVDVRVSLEESLPEALRPLARVLAGQIRSSVTDGITTVLASDRFASLWEDANRRAHETMVAILRDETRPGVSTADGTVTLDLGTIVRSVGERFGVPESALDRLPPDAGQVVILESDDLASAQSVVQFLDFFSWFLFVVVVGLYVAAVAIATGRRVVMLRNAGVSLLLAGLTLVILRALGVRAVVDAVVRDPDNEPLGTIVGQVATRLLSELAWAAVIYGALIAGFATLLGPHRWAVALRRAVGQVTSSAGLAVVAAVLGVGALIWWSPGHVFDRWVSAIAFLALAVAAVVTLLVVSGRERRGGAAPSVAAAGE